MVGGAFEGWMVGETATVNVPVAVSGGDLLSETMIVIEVLPVGWFDAGVQVNKPVVKPMLAPDGAPLPSVYVSAKGGVFGSEAKRARR